jgi:hypothetical protein
MSVEGMGECMVEGATTKILLEPYYVWGVPAASLQDGQVVMVDNLSAHKGEKVRRLITAVCGGSKP